MRSLFVFVLSIITNPLRADPLAGAWESFHSEANASAWSLYSYGDGIVSPAPWVGPEIVTNPYAYSFFFEGEGVWFFADDLTAGGAFVGDYATQKISGVDISVNVDPVEVDFMDLVVYADGPLGLGYYYSLIYQSEDFGGSPDWYDLSFSFSDNWFSLQDGEYIPFEPGQEFLSSIEEVGIRIFPVDGVTGDSFVGIDDFILVPTVEAPLLSTSLSGANFVLEFTPNPGVSATIEKLDPDFLWASVEGKSGLIGPQAFTTPVNPGAALFRVAAEEKLTEVSSP
jgi:hypothetical protein